MKNVQEIIEVVNAAHSNAVSKGWWEKERTLGELVSLIHTEASEAMEDFRKGHEITEVWYEYKCAVAGIETCTEPRKTVYLNNHTYEEAEVDGKPCGIPSELADIVIRVYDLVGKYEVVEPFANFLIQLFDANSRYNVQENKPFGDNLGWVHASISRILTDSLVEYAADAVYCTYKLAEYSGIDLDEIIEEKMAYNATRPHRHGGKLL